MAEEIHKIENELESGLRDLPSSPHEGIRFLWTPEEVQLLRKIAPVTALKLQEQTGVQMNLEADALFEQAKVLACGILVSLDNPAFKGVTKVPHTQSKVRALEDLCRALKISCPYTQQDVNEGNFLDVSFGIKSFVLDIIEKYFNRDFDITRVVDRPTPYPGAIPFFRTLFGERLDKIIHFGSSVEGEGKDIDLLVLLHELPPDLHRLVWKKAMDLSAEKPVGIVVTRASGLNAYADCNHISREIALQGRLAHGLPIGFPLLSETEFIERSYVHVGKDIKSLRGLLGNDHLMDELVKHPDFLYQMLKIEIWVRRALLQKELGRIVVRSELLALEDFSLPPMRGIISPAELQELLIAVNLRLSKRIGEHVSILGY